MRPGVVIGVLALALILGACNPTIPKYQWQGEEAAVAMLARKSQTVQSVRGTATLVLTSVDNQHVTLDAAIVARSAADHSAACLRVRTWKFGHAVFDLTARPDGVWLAAESGQSDQPDERLTSLKPEQISQAWNLFFGDFFSRPGLIISVDPHGKALFLERREGGVAVACMVDTESLLPRYYRILDEEGHVRQTLALSRYRLIGDTAWPMQVIARGDLGAIEVRFDEVEINPQIEDSVFTPPRRAVKQP